MTKLKYDQCVRGDVKISKTDEKKYKIKFQKISDFLVYQVWVKDKTVNENRNVLNQKAIDWVNTNFTNNKNISFTPTTVMELGNKKYVFVITNAYMNKKNDVVFSVSTKSINTESLSNSRLPIGKFQNVRFDIDSIGPPNPCIQTPCTCSNFSNGIQLGGVSGLYYLPISTTNTAPLWDPINGYSFCFCNSCISPGAGGIFQYNFNVNNTNITDIPNDIYCMIGSTLGIIPNIPFPNIPSLNPSTYTSNCLTCSPTDTNCLISDFQNTIESISMYIGNSTIATPNNFIINSYPGTAGLSLVGLALSNQAGATITYSLVPPLLAGASISNNTLYLPETVNPNPNPTNIIFIQASQPYINGTSSVCFILTLEYINANPPTSNNFFQLSNSGLYYLSINTTGITTLNYPPALWDSINGYSFYFVSQTGGFQYNFNVTNTNITNLSTNLPDLYILFYNTLHPSSSTPASSYYLFPNITLPQPPPNTNNLPLNNITFAANSNSPLYSSIDNFITSYPGTAGLSLLDLVSSNQAGVITYSLVPPLVSGASISNNTLYLPETVALGTTILIQVSQPYFNGTISSQLFFILDY